MTTIAAERLRDIEALIDLTRDEPLRMLEGQEERLIVMSPAQFAKRSRQRPPPVVTTELEPELMEALVAYQPSPDMPDYDPWEEEPHLRPDL